MRLRQLGLAGILFLCGCLRYGYEIQQAVNERPDASGMDAAVVDAGERPPAGHIDAGAPDASSMDAGRARDAAVSDARAELDGDLRRDSGVLSDAGAPPDDEDDAGLDASLDGGADAAVSGDGLCALGVLTNSYQGTPPAYGTLTLVNLDSVTWTLPTIRFDFYSTAYVCNNPSVLPGTGWTLQARAGHCEYTKTSPPLSIAPNGMLVFVYTSDNPNSLSANAVTNISVGGCH